MINIRRQVVKIYGERNCGTRLLQTILSTAPGIQLLSQGHSFVGSKLAAKLNSKIPNRIDGRTMQVLKDKDTLQYADKTLGWKHAFPHIDALEKFKAPVVVLVIAKHPFFWAKSLQNRSYAHYSPQDFSELKFEEYLKALYIPPLRENAPDLYYNSVLNAYAAKLKSYLDLARAHREVYFVQYETILTDPETFLEQLGIVLKRRTKFKMPTISTKDKGIGFDDYAQKYTVDRLRTQIGPYQRSFKKSYPEKVLNIFGYSNAEPFITKKINLKRLVK